MKKTAFQIVSLVALAGPAIGQESIVDVLRERGQDSSFQARSQLWQESGLSGRFTGSAAQNRILLNMLREGGAPDGASRIEAPQMSRSRPPYLTDKEWSDHRRFICAPNEEKDSLDTKVLRWVRPTPQPSCCGAGFDCSGQPEVCSKFDWFYSQPQERACREHDSALRDAKAPWYRLDNPDVRRAHQRLTEQSTDWKIQSPIGVLNRVGTKTFGDNVERRSMLDD